MNCSYRLEEAREELDEFQMSSRELEAELEAQLEQAEVKNKELLSANGRLTMEVEMLRVCTVIIRHPKVYVTPLNRDKQSKTRCRIVLQK